MTMPPQGGWQPPQQPGQPQNPGQPHGGQQFNPPGYNPQQPPPPGYPQGPWPQQPGPPPQKGNSLKWLLIAVAVLLVIGISVGATLIFTRGGGGGGGPTPTSQTPSDIASANDTGPVKVITEEPTCKTFSGINSRLAAAETDGWSTARDSLGPASTWTPEQQAKVQSVAKSARDAADQVVPLTKQTPNRVVRELYGQFIAYSRAYAASVPNYTPSDDGLATVFVNASTAMIGICNSIELGSASRSLSVDPAANPTQVSTPGDPVNPQQFVTSSSATCTAWNARLDKFNSESSPDWQNRDTSIPATQWTPEQRAISEAAQPLLTAYANDIDVAGRQSSNPVFEDFSTLAALYLRAYVSAGDTYVNADGWLSYTGFQIANLISGACLAVEG